jgi:transposase
VTVARWRDQVGVPVRIGRPSAITAELAEAGKQLLKGGASVSEVCEQLGVARSSWYRYVHRDAVELQLRPAVRRRRTNAIRPAIEKQMRRLDRQGLSRRAIAERLGLHPNTVTKYLVRR